MKMRGFVDEQDTSNHKHEKPIKSCDKEWWETHERGNLVGSAHEFRQVGPHVMCRCQIIRSLSLWSAGTSQVKDRNHKAYRSFIKKAEHLVYIENQFFISGLAGDEIVCWNLYTGLL